MKDLTTFEAEWLAVALERGYGHPFHAFPYKPLRSLERKKLIEHNPCSGGPGALRYTEWRPTQKAVDGYEVL